MRQCTLYFAAKTRIKVKDLTVTGDDISDLNRDTVIVSRIADRESN